MANASVRLERGKRRFGVENRHTPHRAPRGQPVHPAHGARPPRQIADIAAALRDEEISVEALLQRGRAPDEVVPVVLTTHDTQDAAMTRALERIGAIETVIEPPRRIRVEAL